jgi:hypothetical protein
MLLRLMCPISSYFQTRMCAFERDARPLLLRVRGSHLPLLLHRKALAKESVRKHFFLWPTCNGRESDSDREFF